MTRLKKEELQNLVEREVRKIVIEEAKKIKHYNQTNEWKDYPNSFSYIINMQIIWSIIYNNLPKNKQYIKNKVRKEVELQSKIYDVDTYFLSDNVFNKLKEINKMSVHTI